MFRHAYERASDLSPFQTAFWPRWPHRLWPLVAAGMLVACHSRPVDQTGDAAITSSTSSTDQGGVTILLGLADAAFKEHRLVAPQGSNVFEFYLSVLQLEPHNLAAQTGLRDALPEAMHDVEQNIDVQRLDEAQRELALLREFDATNYELALLGGKLEAYRQLKIRQDEARAAQMQGANTP